MNGSTFSPDTRDRLAELVQMLIDDKTLPAELTLVPSSKSAKVARVHLRGEVFFIKIFLQRDMVERVKTLLRGSRAARAERAARVLEREGFHTPPVVMSGEAGAASWMITRAVDGIALGLYADAFLRGPLSVERLAWKRCLLRALGELVGGLHRKGIIHGDSRLNNVLIDPHARTPRFYLVDNERNRHFSGSPPVKLRIKNLVQVGLLYPPIASRADRLRFSRSYCGDRAILRSPGCKTLIQAVERRLRFRLGQLARKPLRKNPIRSEDVSNVPA